MKKLLIALALMATSTGAMAQYVTPTPSVRRMQERATVDRIMRQIETDRRRERNYRPDGYMELNEGIPTFARGEYAVRPQDCGTKRSLKLTPTGFRVGAPVTSAVTSNGYFDAGAFKMDHTRVNVSPAGGYRYFSAWGHYNGERGQWFFDVYDDGLLDLSSPDLGIAVAKFRACAAVVSAPSSGKTTSSGPPMP